MATEKTVLQKQMEQHQADAGALALLREYRKHEQRLKNPLGIRQPIISQRLRQKLSGVSSLYRDCL
jgi:hypothetical protein